MKKALFFSLILCIPFWGFGTEPYNIANPPFTAKASKQKNVAKMSLLRIVHPLHRDLDFGYERMLTKKLSASLSLAFKVPYIPGFASQFNNQTQTIYDDNGVLIAQSTLELSPLKGFGFTPELKIYTSNSNDAPHGFYLAPYFKYYATKMGASSSVQFTDPLTQDATSSVNLKFTEMGGGLQLGYQWVIGPGVTIDWYFFGPRFSKFNFQLLFEGNLGDPSYYSEAEEEMKAEFKDIPIIGENVRTTSTSSSLELNAPFWLANIRSGFAFGAAF